MTTASTTRRLFALLLCACVLALPACDSDDSDDGNTSSAIAGTWESSFVADQGEVDVEMTLDSDGSLVEGNGNASESGMTYNFDISGSYNDPDVSLNFNPQTAGGFSLTFDGEVTGGGDVMVGTIENQQGLEVDGVTFERQ